LPDWRVIFSHGSKSKIPGTGDFEGKEWLMVDKGRRRKGSKYRNY
jgi:hypothetical protein